MLPLKYEHKLLIYVNYTIVNICQVAAFDILPFSYPAIHVKMRNLSTEI